MPERESHHPFFPATGIRTFGRELSLAALAPADALCSLTTEQAGRSQILLQRKSSPAASPVLLGGGMQCHQSCCFSDSGGRAFVVWNGVSDGTWGIYIHRDDPSGGGGDGVECVRQAQGFCLPPVGVCDGGQVVLAWAECVAGVLRIMVAFRRGDAWSDPQVVSDGRNDAARPSLCLKEGGILVAWDEYQAGRFEIRLAEVEGGVCRLVASIRRAGENRFAPRLLKVGDSVYVAFLATQMVMNGAFVVDHACYGLVGKVRAGGVDLMGVGETAAELAVADLREGLLAADHHYNYEGLRRNPVILPGVGGRLHCLWERRPRNKANNDPTGQLVGRVYDPVRREWGGLYCYHEGCASYALASRGSGRVVAAYTRHTGQGSEILFTEIALEEGGSLLAEPAHGTAWLAWKPVDTIHDRALLPRYRSKINGMGLYWSDTHCHGKFSSDAEGEVDELIHFARDVAHLDAVAITDNDYYPVKSLMPGEWSLQQEFADHFNREGEFVVFPGYEFTCWEETGINHRILLYPSKGGILRRRIDAGSRTVGELYRQLAGDPVRPLAYAHHVRHTLGTDDPLVEICSSWRVCMAESDFTRRQLASGKRFGFIGSSDTHRAVPGLGGAITGIYAESLTRAALLDALRHRRTIASQGFRIGMDFRVNDLFIGEEGVIAGKPLLKAVIQAPRAIEEITLFRDGEACHCRRPGGMMDEFEWRDEAVLAGVHSYYLQVRLTGEAGFNIAPEKNSGETFSLSGPYGHNLARHEGCYAWTSPVWAERN